MNVILSIVADYQLVSDEREIAKPLIFGGCKGKSIELKENL
jgi:hypothetical protein